MFDPIWTVHVVGGVGRFVHVIHPHAYPGRDAFLPTPIDPDGIGIQPALV